MKTPTKVALIAIAAANVTMVAGLNIQLNPIGYLVVLIFSAMMAPLALLSTQVVGKILCLIFNLESLGSLITSFNYSWCAGLIYAIGGAALTMSFKSAFIAGYESSVLIAVLLMITGVGKNGLDKRNAFPRKQAN